MENTPTIFVVDDEPQMRTLLEFLLKEAGYRTETYESAEKFLEGYDPTKPGCLILDIRMAGMDGLQLQEALVARRIPLQVIMISGFAEVPDVVKAIQAGAVDFLKKPFTQQALLERVQKAVELDRRRRESDAEVSGKLSVLSRREREVMDRLLVGRSTKEIARELGISRTTADKHRAKILEKLEADSVVDLVRTFLVNGNDEMPH